ncbi:hypothetical protein Syun_000652 [Stephania yunnanensis]|uniref:Uncharacterized protein n=1 Tax=Stephania yunnanensis TaxID=152371 RepID=A0AAP0LE25_9MAGN
MEHGQSTSELKELEQGAGLINGDLIPIGPPQRTFSGWYMACFWFGIVTNVPAYYLAGGLVDSGMSWWQGVATIVAANTIVSIFLILMGHPGTKYGISFLCLLERPLALEAPIFRPFCELSWPVAGMSQRAQIIGHAGLPLYMGLFTFIGVAVTSSTEVDIWPCHLQSGSTPR